MSDYEPSRFDVTTVSVRLGDACRLVCRECDPSEPEAVRTWQTVGYSLLELDTMAREHWVKWHQR